MEITSSILPPKENIASYNALETAKIAFEAIKKYPVEIILGSIVSLLATVFSFGVLSGALSMGYMLYLEKLLIGGEKPPINILFSKLDKVLPALVLVILTFLIGAICVLPGMIFGSTIVMLISLALSGPGFAIMSIGIYALAKDKTDSGVEALKTGLNTALQYPIEFVKVGVCMLIFNTLLSGGLLGVIKMIFISAFQGLLGYFTAKRVYGE